MFGLKKKSNDLDLEKKSKITEAVNILLTYTNDELDYIYSHEHDAYDEELSITLSHKNSLHFHLAILGITATVGITLLFTLLTIEGIVIVGVEKNLLFAIMILFMTNTIILFIISYLSYTNIDRIIDYRILLSSFSDIVKNYLRNRYKLLDFHKLRVVDCFVLIIKRKIHVVSRN